MYVVFQHSANSWVVFKLFLSSQSVDVLRCEGTTSRLDFMQPGIVSRLPHNHLTSTKPERFFFTKQRPEKNEAVNINKDSYILQPFQPTLFQDSCWVKELGELKNITEQKLAKHPFDKCVYRE